MQKLVISILFSILVVISALSLGANFYLYSQNQTIIEQNNKNINALNQELEEEIKRQRQDKNEIADIFDDQAGLNDDLIDEQNQLILETRQMINYFENNTRFFEGKPQFFDTFTEEEYLRLSNRLLATQDYIKNISEENAEKRQKNSERINQIYLEAGEDRNNTANDREGIRGES